MDKHLPDLIKDSVRAPKGTVLMRQGEIGRSAYFVIEGRLLVEREINGKNFAVAEIGAKDIVGEMAILDDSPRSATVTVIKDAQLLLLDKTRIKQIIRRSPTIAELILKLLCYKLRNAHHFIQNLSSLDNPEFWLKICKTLLLCSQAHQDPKELHHSFCDFVEQVFGIDQEPQYELLAKLAQANLIFINNHIITQVDQHKIKLFLWLGYEDFLNDDVNNPSDVKIYLAAKTILKLFANSADVQHRSTIPYDQLINALISSNLWANLKPTYQKKRATSVVLFLINNDFLQKDTHSQTITINHEHLNTIQIPHDLITTYDKILKNLLPHPLNKKIG